MVDIKAKMLAHSTAEHNIPIATLWLRYPRMFHAEFMTHRVFSRNASSSRALPVHKTMEEAYSDALRAAPLYWGAEQKGMQSGGEIRHIYEAKAVWDDAARNAVDAAKRLVNLGVHKSIVNRLLEPFLHINVVVTSTEWENFFGQRLDEAALPEIRLLAEAIWNEFDSSYPKILNPGEWHLPYVDQEDWDEVMKTHHSLDAMTGVLMKVSAARCARTSYTSFTTGRRSTIEEDLELCKKLVGSLPLHASPLEHQATPDSILIHATDAEIPIWKARGLHGNFSGWIQHRKLIPGEAKAPLPIKYRKG